MTTLYGIKNCDTVKKARRRLDDGGIAYRFHDFRTDSLERAALERFAASLGWETLLNRQSSTWRQLDDSAKADMNQDSALALMLERPTLIKRPVLDSGDGRLFIGLDGVERFLTLSKQP